MSTRLPLVGLFLLILLAGIFIFLEVRNQHAISNQKLPTNTLDPAALTGTWNGNWKAEHYGTLSITFKSSGSFDGKLLGIDVPERGHLIGTVDRSGNVAGSYASPALGQCILQGQFHISSSKHLGGIFVLYSAPKIQKDRVTFDLIK